MVDLFINSIAVLKENQASNGAFVACPSYSSYQYSWLRDGTLIAYALDCVGEHTASRHFYQWVDRTIRGQSETIDILKRKMGEGLNLGPRDFLPTRYSLAGEVREDDWPNLQLDGYGTWLWGLAEHARVVKDYALLVELGESIRLTLNYLELCWSLPGFDCWEEHGNQVHPATLACLAGGIESIAQLICDDAAVDLAAEIKAYLMHYGVKDGRLTKFCLGRLPGRSVHLEDPRINTPARAGSSVDASLLWVAVPFGLLDPLDPIMVNTVREIERKLVRFGGVHRYELDTFYGGGLWVLLTAWLGWYYCRAQRFQDARICLDWVEAQTDPDGFLPEQVPTDLNDPSQFEPWVQRWGPSAKPLLWSHAMYLVLRVELQKPVMEEAAGCI